PFEALKDGFYLDALGLQREVLLMVGRGLLDEAGIDRVARTAGVRLADGRRPDPGLQDQLPVREGDRLFAPMPGVGIGGMLGLAVTGRELTAIAARGPEVAGDKFVLQISVHCALLDGEDSSWLSSPSVSAL